MRVNDIIQNIDDYATGKTWYWYLPLWFFGLYIFFELFQFDMATQQMPIVLLVPYSFNFLLHEISHIVTAFLPAVLTASAGSISEILLGIGLVVMALWQRSYIAFLFCALWFALSCQSAGQYMADALPQQIPLVSLGGALSGQDPVHDWHFVFGQLGLLPISGAIGLMVRIVGMILAAAALIFTAWVIYEMAATSDKTSTPAETTALSARQPHDDSVFTPKNEPPTDDDAPPPGAHDSFS